MDLAWTQSLNGPPGKIGYVACNKLHPHDRVQTSHLPAASCKLLAASISQLSLLPFAKYQTVRLKVKPSPTKHPHNPWTGILHTKLEWFESWVPLSFALMPKSLVQDLCLLKVKNSIKKPNGWNHHVEDKREECQRKAKRCATCKNQRRERASPSHGRKLSHP